MIRQSACGQSLLEAMVGLVLLSAFGVAVHATGRWHDLSIQSLHKSASTVFARAHGKASVKDVHIDNSADRLSAGGPLSTLMTEWNIGESGLIVGSFRAELVRLPAPLPHWVPSPVITRRTYLHGGTGHGQSDAQIQSQTGSSATAWADAARDSASLVRQATATLRPVDSPWRRPSLDIDWLARWPGFVPASLLRGPTP